MPKWSKDATEFPVNVHYSDDKGTQVRIPKPLLEMLGNPEMIKFVVKGNKIHVEPHKLLSSIHNLWYKNDCTN